MFTKEPIWPNFKCYSKARLSWLLLNIKVPFQAPKYSKVNHSTLDYIKAQYNIS